MSAPVDRQDLLASAAAALALVVNAAASAATPTRTTRQASDELDFELIRLCARIIAAGERPGVAMRLTLANARAKTETGHRAKLAVLVRFFKDWPRPEEVDRFLTWEAIEALALTPEQLAAAAGAA